MKSNYAVKGMHPLMRAALIGVVFAGPTPAPTTPAAPSDLAAIDSLRERMMAAHERQNVLRATADAEHRMLNEAEQKELDDLGAQFDAMDQEVERRERIIAQSERLVRPQPRLTQPADLPEAARPARVTGGDRPGATKNSWGWTSMGEYARGVLLAATSGRVDPRLQAAATTYGNEQSQADGGFAVPPDFRETIVKKIQGEDSLLSRTDQQYTSSNKITVPLDNTTPWQTTGGIQATWEDEAVPLPQSKPALNQLEVKANKLTALVPMTDEMLEDVPMLTRYIPGKVADKFTSKLNDALINGGGVGRPLGLLLSPSKVAVDEEDNQAAASILYANIAKMWSRLYAPLRNGAIWIINQDIEPQLFSLVVPGTQPSFPAYMPPGGLSAAPYGTLLGRPVIAQESCSTVGTEGDIILTNLQAYLTAQKVGGMRQDVSMHVYFDQGMTAFRFTMRCGGTSWWKSAAARKNGSNTLSNIVTLADRAG